jgi:cysteinyl-tRNA synthetase
MATREWQFANSVAASFAVSDESRPESSGLAPDEIEQLLAERREARQRKNFKRADEIRESLLRHGVTIEDRPDGTSRWKR